MDPIRRKILKTGAAATAMAAATRVLAQQPGPGEAGMSFFQKGPVRIRYEEAGSGFPLLLIAGGGLNSSVAGLKSGNPFHAIDEFKGEFRCVYADLRNANGGHSSGPLEIDRPWDSYTDDQLALMDHLRIDKFMVMGFCIGGPFIWNLLQRAPDHLIAAVASKPGGWRQELPNLSYESNRQGWVPAITTCQPNLSMEIADRFLTQMSRGGAADCVYTVSCDFVRSCQAPVLVMPDDSPPRPYTIAMESAMLAPQSEVSLLLWKDSKDTIPVAVRQVRSFLRVHRPAMARRKERL
jgi:pimeloyl-ACP methyl ester carboxylesterase